MIIYNYIIKFLYVDNIFKFNELVSNDVRSKKCGVSL